MCVGVTVWFGWGDVICGNTLQAASGYGHEMKQNSDIFTIKANRCTNFSNLFLE